MFLQPPNSSSPVLPFFLPGVSLSSYAQPQPLPRSSLDLKPQTPRPQSSLCCSLWQGRGVHENGAVKAGLPGRRTLAVGGTTSASAAVTTSSSQDPDAAGLVPKARPPQRRPESAGFVSSASLTATLLRTATNISVTAVTETLSVSNLLSLRLVVRTAWELPWQIFLCVWYFFLNHLRADMMDTAHGHIHAPWTVAVLSPSFSSMIML